MEEQGLAIWLIPSEFMDVNYGVTLRRYLTEHVTLLHIHRFCPTDVQFTDALVSSAVVVFRKSPPPAGHTARFSFAGPIEHPAVRKRWCRSKPCAVHANGRSSRPAPRLSDTAS